jgi:hypothetical protein
MALHPAARDAHSPVQAATADRRSEAAPRRRVRTVRESKTAENADRRSVATDRPNDQAIRRTVPARGCSDCCECARAGWHWRESVRRPSEDDGRWRRAMGIVRWTRLARFLIQRRVRAARQHPVAARGMGVVVCRDGSQYADFVCQRRGARHQLADMQPGDTRCDRLEVPTNLGRCVGLRIPGFVLRRTTAQKQEDASLRTADARLRRMCGN